MRRIRFEGFELDLDSADLRRDGTTIRLPPQPARVLACLAARAGELVTREELQQEVWGERYVDLEQGIHNAIRHIRQALGDAAAEPRFVETVPRRGYRFLPRIEPAAAAPAPPPPERERRGLWTAGTLAATAVALVLAAILLADGVQHRPAEGDLARRAVASARGSGIDALDTTLSGPVDPGARQSFLEGRYLASRGDAASLEAALAVFESALALAPDYAPALAAKAQALLRLPETGTRHRADAVATAELAVRLAPGLAAAHLARGDAALFHEWDWARAERAYGRALELAPGEPEPHVHQAFFLAARGRHDDALEEIDRAAAIDPVAAKVQGDRVWLELLARRYERALVEARRLAALEPRHPLARTAVIDALFALGREKEAVAEARLLLRAAGMSERALLPLSHAAPGAGECAYAELLLARLGERPAADLRLTPLARCRRTAEALAAVDAAVAARSGYVPFLGVDPHLDSLRGDPGFAAILTRLGLAGAEVQAEQTSDSQRTAVVD